MAQKAAEKAPETTQAPEAGKVSTLPIAPGHVTAGGHASAYHQSEKQLLEALGLQPIKSVTLPTLPKMKPGDVVALLILGEMHDSNFIEKGAEKAATICNVANMETGEEYTYVVPTVVEKNLREQYPEKAYVGKSFLIRRGEQKENKRYVLYTIREVAGKPGTTDAPRAAA